MTQDIVNIDTNSNNVITNSSNVNTNSSNVNTNSNNANSNNANSPTNPSEDRGKIMINELLDSIKKKKKRNLVAYIDDPSCDAHESVDPEHQESSKRTKIIRKALEVYKIDKLMERGGSITITKSDLTAVHGKEYIEQLITYGRHNKPLILPPPCSDLSMKNINSLEAMFAAAASVMGAVDIVCDDGILSDKNKNQYNTKFIRKVFCNVRPPGHHAHKDKGSGFCFMNNVVIGSMHAMTKYKNIIKKVLIFDWDLHHGDGTEDLVKDNPDIMYCSFHRGGSQEDAFYPYTGTEHKNSLGNVINFPISENESIESYMDKFSQFLELAYAFKPDMVMISAGFDSHKDDLYHALPLDYEHYHVMTKQLMKLADDCSSGRLISVLEGGYTLGVLYRCVLVHITTMINGY